MEKNGESSFLCPPFPPPPFALFPPDSLFTGYWLGGLDIQTCKFNANPQIDNVQIPSKLLKSVVAGKM